MKYKKIIMFLILGGSLFLGYSAKAHQPNFANKEKQILVANPEISQAFYGFLDKQPVQYSINSDSPFQLYIGLLTPDLPGQQNNLIALIQNNPGEEIARLDGSQNFQWERWYEEFAGDWYWKGPEFKQEVPAGQYTVTVFNADNTGKYVLAIGELESFPITEMPQMMKKLFLIKTQFFNKPWHATFQNKIGYGLSIMILILILIISGIVYIVKLLKRKFYAQ